MPNNFIYIDDHEKNQQKLENGLVSAGNYAKALIERNTSGEKYQYSLILCIISLKEPGESSARNSSRKDLDLKWMNPNATSVTYV